MIIARRDGIAVPVVLALLLLNHSGMAQESTTSPVPRVTDPILLSYQAAAGCPREETFVDGLRRLSSNFTVRSMSAPAANARVKLVRQEGGFVGTFEGRDTVRQVQAPACEDAAYALALITVITWDPDAPVAETRLQPKDFAEPTAIPLPASAATSTADDPGRRTQKSLHVSRWSVHVGALGAWGELERTVFGPTAGLFYAATWASLSLDLSAGFGTRLLRLSSLTYDRFSITPAWCPQLLGSGGSAAVYGCLGAELGTARLLAADNGDFAAEPAQWTWHAAGSAALRVDLPVAQAWAVIVSPYATVPLRRDSYIVRTAQGASAEVIEHAVVTAGLSLQVSYEF